MSAAGKPLGIGRARKRHVAPMPILILWTATMMGGCTDADVFRVYEPPPLPQDRITIQGSYCASEPEDLVFPVKILFIFDDSGSMAESDPNFRRLSAALELVDLLLQEQEIYFGAEHFQNAQPMLLTQDPVFTRDRAVLAEALDPSLHQPVGGTPYVGALSTAITAIKGDINADPVMAARTRYVVIFLSDGEPTDDKAPPYPQIMDRVHQLKQLEQGYPAAGEVTLHTAYLESNGDDSGGTHVALLQQMAEETGGQFRDFESGEAIDFTQFDVTAISRDFMAVFPLLVANLNTRPSLAGPVADSDGDGLTDEEEDAMGTDATNPDSDGDGCSDMMEVAYAGWDPLTPGWETSPQHCECKDELRHADSDGDGLTDCEEIWLSLDRKQPDSDYDVEGKPQPDNMLDSLEVWYHLGRTRSDGADDYDRDGVGNLDELVQHMDPNVSDNEMRDEIGYRFEYLYQQQQRPNCYDFRVSNVPVVPTRATPGHAAGVNRILLYFIEAPQDDPHRERVVRAALLQVQFDGWAVEPELLEVRPEDFGALEGRGPEGQSNCSPDGCPPVADAGADRQLVDEDGDGFEQVVLDGSGSHDPNGDIIGYLWREEGITLAKQKRAEVRLGLGRHEIELVVVDDQGLTARDTVVITVSASTSTSSAGIDDGQIPEGGCSSTGGPSGGWWMSLLAVLWLARRRLAALSALVAVLSTGCAPPADIELGVHGLPIINGSPDTDPDHAAIVAFTFGGYMCTGTLVSRDVILTAAHCASGYRPRDFTVYFGQSMNSAQVRYVSEVRVHPGWDSYRLVNDIAMLRLASAPPAGVKPIPYLPKSLGLKQSELPKQLEFIGFGEDEYRRVGQRLTVWNDVDWICTNPSGCVVGSGYGASPNTICSDQSPGGPCHGDSGGPALLERNGRVYVAGITSYGDQYCQYFGCSTKVDEFEQFIADFVGGVLGATCTSDEYCDSGHCVDGVCCESACDGICQSCSVPGAEGLCLPAPDGTPCSDGNACNGQEVCLMQECVSGEPLQCDDGNPCTDDTCDPGSGCVYTPVDDGTPCADGDVCNGEETCRQGVCTVGQPLDCDDGNPCSLDECDPQAGCKHTPLEDGTDCSGGVCGQAACTGGMCMPQDGSCDDENPCTEDFCNPSDGCRHTPLADGYKVPGCLLCQGGQPVPDTECVVRGSCGCSSTGRKEGAGFVVVLLCLVATLPAARKKW